MLFLLVFTGTVSANSASPVVLHSAISQALLAPQVTFYKDPSKKLTIEAIIDRKLDDFAPLLNEKINQGFSDEVFWLKLALYNPSDAEIHWVIHHETSYLDVMSVHYKTGDEPFKNTYITDHKDFSHRSIEYRKLNFAHQTPAKQTTQLFIKLQMIDKDALTLALNIQSNEVFNKSKADEQFFYGMYFGITFALIIISLIFSLTIRQKLYFTYTINLIIHFIFWGFLTGYIFQYVIPNFPTVYNQGFNIVFIAFFISALQFSKQFLNTALYSPKINKLLIALQIFSVAAILLRLFGVYELVLHISHFSLLSLALLPFVGWQAYRQGLKYARWYILAWTVFGIGLLFSVLSASTNIFSWGMEPIVYTQIFGLLESFLLMLALADKVNQVNKKLTLVTQEAQQDFLTRLGNRRLLEQKFNQIVMSSNQDKNYWCLVLDIDDFKSINDNYGHAFGDVVLQSLANTFNQMCRPEDLVIRYGGEEFVILLESSDITIVKHIAERIRATVESTVLTHKNEEVSTTISIGISAVSFEKNKPFELSFKNADKALYQVKSTTKNGIAIFQNSKIVIL